MKTILYSLIFSLLFVSCTASNPSTNNTSNEPKKLSDDQLLDLVQKQTFAYFWDYAEPNSGLARERFLPHNPSFDQQIVTTGGSGFGLMSIIAATNRAYISKDAAIKRLDKIANFLQNADRFHGAWPHWINGNTGKVIPFGQKDNGGDLVETAFLATGFITVREYFKNGNDTEKKLANKYDKLLQSIEWNWYTNNQNFLYWHWSPDYQWQMNFPLQGYNETLITYILAASSKNHAITPQVFHNGWAQNGAIKSSKTQYNLPLLLKHNGAEDFGGPLFWAHYSFLGLDPNQLSDDYVDYWKLNQNHTLINYQYCVQNPKKFNGYAPNFWGLTASYSRNQDGTIGYDAHMPSNDSGVVSPTAAISSIVYTPEQSISFIRNLYENHNKLAWGIAGFYDAISIHHNWNAPQYLAIDQGPEIVMIENYRSGLLWNLFMNAPEIKSALPKLGFHSNKHNIH